jgi:hypothetical protein
VTPQKWRARVIETLRDHEDFAIARRLEIRWSLVPEPPAATGMKSAQSPYVESEARRRELRGLPPPPGPSRVLMGDERQATYRARFLAKKKARGRAAG